MVRKFKKHHSWLVVGIIIGALVVGIISAFVFVHNENQTNQIIAPYFQKEDLTPPPNHRPPTHIDLEKRTAVKIPIIMYHYVEYVADVNDLVRKRLAITPYSFEQQLKTFKEYNYETYFVRDMPDILDDKIHISTRSAILTFDDGYEDFYTDVFPLLKKYNMKATIYIIYDYIGRKGFLNKTQIQELAKHPELVEIGSHTLDHLYLKLMPKTIAHSQIFESKTKLEEDYGIKIDTFAYPYGAFDDDAVHMVKDATYSAAVSVIPGAIHSRESLFTLSRIRDGALTSGAPMVHFLDSYSK